MRKERDMDFGSFEQEVKGRDEDQAARTPRVVETNTIPASRRRSSGETSSIEPCSSVATDQGDWPSQHMRKRGGGSMQWRTNLYRKSALDADGCRICNEKTGLGWDRKDIAQAVRETSRERSRTPPPLESSTLTLRCEFFQAEIEYLRERELDLQEELSRARAENAALSAELKRTHDVYKEALAARRTAREALSEMAQQNARLVSAFVEKKKDFRNLQETLNEERTVWTSRLEALEAELQTAKEEVEDLRAPRTETSMQQPDSDSDEASDILLGNSSDEEEGFLPVLSSTQRSELEEAGSDSESRTLREIQLENIRLQEENKILRQTCQEAKRKEKLLDIRQQAEEIKQNGNNLFRKERYQEAAEEYTRALDLEVDDSMLKAVLYCNRAAAFLNLNRFLEALADCFSSIDADESYLRAHQRRADVYLALGDFSSAAQDLISLLNRGDRDRPEVVGALADIKRRERLGGSVCIDPYRVLEVSPIASAAEIKSAYRQMALKYHPDKAGGLAGSGVLFKLVARAYDILSDPEKKRLHDNSIRNRVHKPFYGGH